MSADLVWELTRSWNCHQLRRTHPVRKFTTDVGTLNHSVSFVDSGLANRKAVDVRPDADGVPEISLKNDSEEDLRKPDKMWTTTTLNGGARKAIARADAKLTTYNPSGKKFALRRVSAIARATAREKAGVNHESVKKGRMTSH